MSDKGSVSYEGYTSVTLDKLKGLSVSYFLFI